MIMFKRVRFGHVSGYGGVHFDSETASKTYNGIARRVFRDRNNPLDYMNDMDLLQNYRLDRQTIIQLCGELEQGLRRPTQRTNALPVSLIVTLALRYYATGSFQAVLANSHGVTPIAVSRSIHSVSRELCRFYQNNIMFPMTQAQQTKTKQDFYAISGFPNVIGAVDGTFVPIIAPSVEEHLYVTRKGFHAINVQGICDANNIFLNVVVRWPGSTHDAYIWNNCAVSNFLTEEHFNTTWLLGDSAYPLKDHLLTPVLTPTTAAERRYNSAHKRTRCVIERTYGLWKMRFRCLHKSGGYLMYSPPKSINIICATAILHNICMRKRLPLPDDDIPDDEDGETGDDPDGDGMEANMNGQNVCGRRVTASQGYCHTTNIWLIVELPKPYQDTLYTSAKPVYYVL